MKASIKLITTEKQTSKGFPVYVRLFNDGKTYKKCIGHSFTHFWDKTVARPVKQHPEYFDLLPIVLEYYAKTIKVNLGNYDFSEASAMLFGDVVKTQSAGFLAFFDVRIKEKEIKGLSNNSYKNVKSIIKEFIDSDDIAINAVTYEWLNTFVLYKLQHGANNGGVMSYLRDMRAVYKEAQRRTSLNVNAGNPFLGVIINPTPKPVIALSPTDFKKLLDFNFDENTTVKNKLSINKRLAIWLFQFYIGGHDYIDVSLLEWTNIENGRVRFKRYKNRNKKNGGPEINNLLVDPALQIIAQFGTKKHKRVFGFIPSVKENEGNYIKYRKNVNNSLQRVSKRLHFNPGIRTKSPRYIFRTYAGELLIHDLIVMKLQGHTPEGVTYRYQGVISFKVLNEAHAKIIALK